MSLALRRTVATLAFFALPGCNGPIDASNLREPSPCAERGRKACEAACARDDRDACLTASLGYPKNREAMMELELRSCELGSPQGCYYYANNFKQSADDRATAREYAERACSLGWGKACVWLASSYLRAPGDDPYEVEDIGAARDRWQAACAAEPRHCGGLADFEALGLGGEKDEAAAREHWQMACETDNGPACANLRDEDPRVWLQAPNAGLIHTIKFEKLNLELQGAMPGQEFELVAGACFENGGGYEPAATVIIESSGIPALDEAIAHNLGAWRARPKAVVPDGRAACISITHTLRNSGRITAL